MAWLQSHQELARHPKTKRVARLLGVSLPTTIGHLHMLWWWCLDFAQSGDLSGYDDAEIADSALWEGDASEFVEALVQAGFLRVEDNGLVVHDWQDYGGKLIEERRAGAERSKRSRINRQQNEACASVSRNTRESLEDVSDAFAVRVDKSRVEEIPPPPAPAREATNVRLVAPNLPSNDPVFVALQNVTGWLHGMKRPTHDSELIAAALALRNKSSPSATPETIADFGVRWKESGKTSPAPGQVVSEWDNVFNPPKREVKNSHGTNKPAVGAGYPTASERTSAKWEDAVAELS